MITDGRREIGGYIELDRFSGQPYHREENGAIALNCCRSAFLYALELRGVQTLWLPDFMCDCMENSCAQVGVSVRTFPVAEQMLPDYDAFSIGEDEWMLLADYYGQLSAADVERAHSASGGRLIVDETQGFFRKPWKGIDTLFSCRKFLGVPDGGYFYSGDGTTLTHDLPVAESHEYMGYVLGRFERPAGEYYVEAAQNNDRFEGDPPTRMSPVTQNFLRAIDYDVTKARREANFTWLHERLSERNLLDLTMPDGPFMYPLLVEDAGTVRKTLAAQSIFVPTLWPNCLEDCPADSMAYRFAKNILPLPIDQRYDEQDMALMLDSLEAALGW